MPVIASDTKQDMLYNFRQFVQYQTSDVRMAYRPCWKPYKFPEKSVTTLISEHVTTTRTWAEHVLYILYIQIKIE